MSNSILVSVYALAKNNNGFFKSEKQAAFLTAELDKAQGTFIEGFSFGEYNGAYSTRTVTVAYDAQGITEIKTTGDKTRKTVIKFTRQDSELFAAKQAVKQAEIAQAKVDTIAFHQQAIAQHKQVIEAIQNELGAFKTALQQPLVEGKITQEQYADMVDTYTKMNQPKIDKALSDISYHESRLTEYL
jgi:hypothetical protein